MVVSGLVVTLDPDSREGLSAIAAIRAEPAFEVGERNGRWLSLSLEASDAAESERWHDWLTRLPGVQGVEVVFVHWDVAEVTHVGA